MLEFKYLRDGQSLDLNSTYKVDLPNSGKLSGIIMRFSADQQTGFGQAGGNWRLLDYMTGFRVVGDGSEVILDITGKQALAKWFFDHKEVCPSVWRNYATETQFEVVGLTFGRRLGDRLLGLDLSRFNSVQLEITNTATSTQFQDTLAVSIVLAQHHSQLNPPSFMGYIKTEKWREYTTVQNGWQYHELPKSGKLRRIILQCVPAKTTGLDNTTFWNLADDIRLALKTGALEVVRAGADDIARANGMMFGMPVQPIQGQYWSADAAHENGVGYWLGIAAVAGSRDGEAAAVIPTLTQGDTGGTPRMETYEADGPVPMLVKGLAPHYCIVPYQSDLDEPQDFLDLVEHATVQFDVHTANSSSAASGTNYVVLERLVS